MVLTMAVPWYTYCYWNFSLKRRTAVFGFNDATDGSITGLYDSYCDPPSEKFSNCPDLCRSVKDVRYSGDNMIGFGVAAISMAVVAIVAGCSKMRRRSSRVLNWVIYLATIASFVLYLVGMLTYKAKSKFDSHFKNVDNHPNDEYSMNDSPDDFSWNAGYVISIIALIIQALAIICSKYFTLKNRDN